MLTFFSDIWKYIKVRKKYWLLPLIIIIICVSGILYIGKGSVISLYIPIF